MFTLDSMVAGGEKIVRKRYVEWKKLVCLCVRVYVCMRERKRKWKSNQSKRPARMNKETRVEENLIVVVAVVVVGKVCQRKLKMERRGKKKKARPRGRSQQTTEQPRAWRHAAAALKRGELFFLLLPPYLPTYPPLFSFFASSSNWFFGVSRIPP